MGVLLDARVRVDLKFFICVELVSTSPFPLVGRRRAAGRVVYIHTLFLRQLFFRRNALLTQGNRPGQKDCSGNSIRYFTR